MGTSFALGFPEPGGPASPLPSLGSSSTTPVACAADGEEPDERWDPSIYPCSFFDRNCSCSGSKAESTADLSSSTPNHDTPGRVILCRIAHNLRGDPTNSHRGCRCLSPQDGSEQLRPFKIPVLSDHGTRDELFFSLYSGLLN